MPRQSKKASRKLNPIVVILILGFSLLFLLVIGLLYAKSRADAWLKGDGFQQLVVNKASAAMSSKVTMADLKWQGDEVYTDEFEALGYEGAPFSSLKLDGVRVKTDGIKARAFRIPSVSVNRLNLEFSDQRVESPNESEVIETAQDSGPAVPEWLRKFLPNRVELDEIAVGAARVVVLNADGAPTFLLKDSRGKVRPDFHTQIWEVLLEGGAMQLPGQEEIGIRDLAMRWKGGDLFIDRSALKVFGDGNLEAAGEIGFSQGTVFDLDLDLSSINIDHLLDEKWQERLGGSIEGPVKVTGKPGAMVYEGEIRVDEATAESIPVLKLIAEYTKNKQFEQLAFSEASAQFRRAGQRTELENIVLQSDGLVRVEGDVTIDGELLDGNCQVGVTPGTLRWIPGAERQVFTESRDGFLWAPLKLSGTISDPKEDLSRRLIMAAGAEILKALPEELMNQATDILSGATGEESEDGKPSNLIDKAKPILDALSPFLKRP